MSIALGKEGRKYTYKDYLTWDDNQIRYELIDGLPYAMAPAPSRRHQRVSIALSSILFSYLEGKTCEVYEAPFDVRLGKEKDEDKINIVQPDIVVICDQSKLDDKGCNGCPDLIIEIISPASAAVDFIKKFNLYEREGVKEYWLIHPIDGLISVYQLSEQGKYGRPDHYSKEDQIKVGIFPDLVIDLKRVFADIES